MSHLWGVNRKSLTTGSPPSSPLNSLKQTTAVPFISISFTSPAKEKPGDPFEKVSGLLERKQSGALNEGIQFLLCQPANLCLSSKCVGAPQNRLFPGETWLFPTFCRRFSFSRISKITGKGFTESLRLSEEHLHQQHSGCQGGGSLEEAMAECPATTTNLIKAMTAVATRRTRPDRCSGFRETLSPLQRLY